MTESGLEQTDEWAFELEIEPFIKLETGINKYEPKDVLTKEVDPKFFKKGKK